MKIEVSTGEVVDKVSILEIKLEKFTNEEKKKNVRKEYELLKADMEAQGITTDSENYLALKKVNLQLWDIEDNIRIKEHRSEFDQEFIELARSVYFTNDVRADIKKKINMEFNSDLVEEKEYVDYKQA